MEDVRAEWKFLQKVDGTMSFPGNSGINGYIIGLKVKCYWDDGTNGQWCIGKNIQLGTKQVTVKVQSEGTRGYHVSHVEVFETLSISDFRYFHL